VPASWALLLLLSCGVSPRNTDAGMCVCRPGR